MRKFFSLLKLQINAQYGFSNALYNIKHDKKAFWKAQEQGSYYWRGEVIGFIPFAQLYSGAAMINTPDDIDDGGDMFRADSTGIFYITGTFFLPGH